MSCVQLCQKMQGSYKSLFFNLLQTVDFRSWTVAAVSQSADYAARSGSGVGQSAAHPAACSGPGPAAVRCVHARSNTCTSTHTSDDQHHRHPALLGCSSYSTFFTINSTNDRTSTIFAREFEPSSQQYNLTYNHRFYKTSKWKYFVGNGTWRPNFKNNSKNSLIFEIFLNFLEYTYVTMKYYY